MSVHTDEHGVDSVNRISIDKVRSRGVVMGVKEQACIINRPMVITSCYLAYR